MQDTRQSLKTTIYFLLDNWNSATVVEYIATKYSLQLNPQKTLTENAQSLVDHLMQYTSSLADEQPESKLNVPAPGNFSTPPAAREIRLEFQPRLFLPAYMGKWYTAASIPQPFDRGTAWKTADYELAQTSGRQLPSVKVTNTAYNQDDSVRAAIVGSAQVVDPLNLAALHVSFPTGQPSNSATSPRANYLIHRTDYDNYAVVGSSDGSNLYLLVRRRPISADFYDKLVEYAKSLGYDTGRLVQDYGSVQ